MTLSSLPSDSQHLAALRALQLIPAADDCSLRPISRNQERLAGGVSARYVLTGPNRPRQVLYVGADLAVVAARSRAFATAYPQLACAVTGEGRHQGWHYLLFEYFAGQPAIDLAGQSENGTERVLIALEKVAEQFSAAERASTVEAARAELGEFGRQVLALPYWTPLDRSYLETLVLPFLHEQLVSLQPTRRFTNGDLILRNLLIDDAGAVRIIDYEFAADSHFHREDWLRLTYWDVVPEEIRTFAFERVGALAPLRVYLALKQMVTEAQNNLPQKAVADARHWTEVIRQSLVAATSHNRQSLFWPALEPSADGTGIGLQAELFWMTDDGWTIENSAVIAARTGPHQTVRFVIPAGKAIHAFRFDPMNAPGVATLYNVVIRRLDPTPLATYSAFGPEALAMAVPAGDAIACPPSAEDFQIVSTGSDPQLHFNQAGGPADSRIEVEVTFALSVEPSDQVELLRAVVNRLRTAPPPPPSAANLDRTAEIAALAGHLHRWFTGEDGLRARLSTEFALQRKAEQADHATTAQLTVARSLLAEREKDIAQLREQLTGYATTIDRLELALKAAQEEMSRQIKLREEAAGHQRGAEDHLGRLSQELAAVNERATLLAQQLAEARKPRGWFGR
jgi:hypothetical protein